MAIATGSTRAADQPTTILTRAEPVESWDVIADDDPLLDDPQSWRRSQLATVGVIAAILLLAGLGVVLWNLLAEDPDSLATVPSVSTTAVPTTFETEATPPQTTLPQPGTTGPGTLPDLTPMTIPPTFPTPGPADAGTSTADGHRHGDGAPDGAAGERQPGHVAAWHDRAGHDPRHRGGRHRCADRRHDTAAADGSAGDAATRDRPASDDAAEPAGSAQALQDPQPSGLSYGEVAGSHALAQQLADALALEQWGNARGAVASAVGEQRCHARRRVRRSRPGLAAARRRPSRG